MKEYLKPVLIVVAGLILFTVLEKPIKKALSSTGMWEENA